MNSLKNIAGLIYKPEKSMKEILKTSHFLIMAAFVIISKILLLLFRYDLFSEYCKVNTKEYMEYSNILYNLNLTQAQIGEIVDTAPIESLKNAFGSAILMYFLSSFFVWALIKLLRGDGKLKHCLCLMAYSHLPLVLSYVFLGAVSIFTNDLYFNMSFTSIGYYVSETLHPFVIGLLAGVEIFAIWKYILVYFGLMSFDNLSKQKNIFISVLLFGVLVLISGINVWVSTLVV